MALIKCPKCERGNVSDSAEMCPDCGYGIAASSLRTKWFAGTRSFKLINSI